MPAASSEHPRVPISRFHSDIDDVLDAATTQPVVLTDHGRERYVIADSSYFHRLERMACNFIAKQMRLEVVSSFNMTAADKRAFAKGRPTTSELAKDRWEDCLAMLPGRNRKLIP